MSSVCFWLFLILVSSVSSEDDRSVANDYIDQVLDNLRNQKEMVQKIDPLNVPDINEAKFKGWNIWIRGLSSLHRSGDCVLLNNGDMYVVQGHIAVNNVAVNLNYKAKAGFFWISGIIEAKLDRLAVYVHASFNQNDGTVELKEFKVTEFGTIHVGKVTGLSVILNWLLKIIVNKVINNSKSRIINAVETEVSKIISAELKKVKIPV